MNAELAEHVLAQLRSTGVEEICICPGGRNAPWVELLAGSEYQFRVTWHFEERAAAFFALGRARSTSLPVAVCTTSGTAAGELLPATMEAYYSGAPLILLTADRPRRFRGSGAPQSAEQSKLFGPYTAASFDLEGDERLDMRDIGTDGPVHINVCFEEPRAGEGVSFCEGSQRPAEDPVGELSKFLATTERPLVVLGALSPGERNSVERFLVQLEAPVYAEALSGLRESKALEPLRLKVGDRLFERAAGAGYPITGVLRLGGVPTHRFWRDLEDKRAALPVVSVSHLPFSGLGRGSVLCLGGICELLDGLEFGPAGGAAASLCERDREAAHGLGKVVENEFSSEPAQFHALSKRIEPGSLVFLGNSLPVREWDLAATWESRDLDVVASRGLNGIDGQISTFLGLCKPDAPNWAILGDLTTLYDLAGPWVREQLSTGTQATIVVVNNGGGRIFERMFGEPEFQNSHGIGFQAWAEMWGLRYELCHSAEEIFDSVEGIRVVELRPDADSTARFWKSYERSLG